MSWQTKVNQPMKLINLLFWTSDRTLLQPAAGAGHGRDRHRPGGQESGGQLRGAVRGAVPRGEGAGRGAWPGHVTRDT